MIEQFLEDPLAEKLLQNPGKGGSLAVSIENDKPVFTEQVVPPSEEATTLALSSPTDPKKS